MKRKMLEILVCPMCHGELSLTGAEEQGEEIVTGSLFCSRCQHSYPIEEAIPNLLPPEDKGDQPRASSTTTPGR